MRYLIIGSGGREHALYWRLLNDGSASEVFVAPGNGGIDSEYCVNIAIDNFDEIASFCIENKIDMVVVGPEAPLVAGIVDYLNAKKIPVFGPTREAAMLEGSKLFAKSIMEKYGIPTAEHYDFVGNKELLEFINGLEKYPIVIKLDGLAAGKGVAIPESKQEAIDFINENVSDDTRVFVEEYLTGEEASVLGISDGKTVYSFVAAQDHKRIFDGDKGPNTGGMGAYAPAPIVTPELLQRVQDQVLQPTIDGMAEEEIPFKGILYAGLIIDGDQISVLEFNVRFGDPETQVVLPLLKGKLGDLFKASVEGTLDKLNIEFSNNHAITVVMSSAGYPGSYEKGKKISGIDTVADDILVFHAGTKRQNGVIATNGGRVLNITALDKSLFAAKQHVYEEIEKISFDGAFYRKDIAHRAL